MTCTEIINKMQTFQGILRNMQVEKRKNNIKVK